MNLINNTLWIVTKPRPLSTLADVCFSTDWDGLQRQFLGGLKPSDIVGIYISESEAVPHAKKLFKESRP